jgi:ATP:ADP antiporter, AAA family
VTARRHAIAAGLTLFVIMAGHTVLETARDSLFLARMPIERLPWAYVLISVAALVAAEFDRHLRRRIPPRRLLSLTLLGGALGCVGFSEPFRQHATWAPHAFYVWVALIATLAITQFWLLLSELFTVAEAKRLYSLIAAGGMLGAGFGGALTRIGSSQARGDGWLLLLGAALLALAGLPGFFAPAEVDNAAAPELGTMRNASSAALRDLRSERYLRRVLVLTLLSTITVTLIDFLFKAEIARSVAPAELSGFFGTYNAWLSAAAVAAQFLLAPQLLQSLGAGRALLVLPFALALTTLGALAAPGLVALMLLRGTDGSLRHSLHRSSLEVLYLPLPSQARARWKMVVDVLGQRGGQALAAFVILACLAIAAPLWAMLGLVLCACLGWIGLSATMERHYLALFRAKLRARSIETRAQVPELDVRSLESLVAALGSEDDDEVLAAIDLLVEYDRPSAISALLLYHPSRAVVLRALEVLSSSDRHDFDGAARRLLSRDDDEIKAAATLALAGHMGAPELQRELDSATPIAARAALLVALRARALGADDNCGEADGNCGEEVELSIAPGADEETRIAFARAFRLRGDQCCVPALARLAEQAGPRLQLEVARAMLAVPHEAHVPSLIAMLANRNVRQVARDALVAIGGPALVALASSAGDPDLLRSVRAHLPRSVARFGSAAATDLLLDWFEHEHDGWVRFKIIRALGLLRPHLLAQARRQRVLAFGRQALVRGLHIMSIRIATEQDRLADARLSTQCGELLVAVLREKEDHAVDRAVRLIGLLHSANDIHNIRQALAQRDRRFRADGVEVLVHKAPQDLARAISVLLDNGRDEARLTRAAEALHESVAPRSYEERLRLLLTDDSVAVRCVAAHHVGELGLITLADAVIKAESESAALGGGAMTSEVFARVRERLAHTRTAPARLGTGIHSVVPEPTMRLRGAS